MPRPAKSTPTTDEPAMEPATTHSSSSSCHFIQNIAPTPLPFFRGLDDDVGCENFVETAKRTTQAFQMPEAVAAEWVISFLQGPARDEILSRPLEERDTGDKILEVLSSTFQARPSAIDCSRRFHLRRQGASESLLAYAQSLKSLATRANLARHDAVPDWALNDRFIDGVASTSLKSYLRSFNRSNQGVSFYALREEARRWTSDNPECAVDQVTATQIEDLRATVAALTARLTGETTLPYREERHTTLPYREERQMETFHRCDWCDRPGHIEVDCRTKRKYLERQHLQNETRERLPQQTRDRWQTETRQRWPETRYRQPQTETRKRWQTETRERLPQQTRDRWQTETRERWPETRERLPQQTRDRWQTETRERWPRQQTESHKQPQTETRRTEADSIGSSDKTHQLPGCRTNQGNC